MRSVGLKLGLVAGFMVVAGSAIAAPTQPYAGHRLVRVHPHTDAELQTLLALADDVFSERVGLRPIDLRLSPLGFAALQATGLDFTVVVEDLQLGVDAERERLQAHPAPVAGADFFTDFQDVTAIDAKLDEIAGVSDVVAVMDVGQSVEDRLIRGLTIGVPAQGKPELLILGTLHAREWITTMSTTCVAFRLASDYGNDDAITALVDDVVIHVIPVANPDGYAYSWTDERYWRKNRGQTDGVDLNRNWSLQWGLVGASSNPADDTYMGPEPFSEPETAHLRDFMIGHPGIRGFIDFHSYAELVLYPWGWTVDPAPDDAALSALAGELSSVMEAQHDYPFPPLQAAGLYPASGASDDYAYGDRAMFAFTIEMRGPDFVLPSDQIVPSCDEAYASVRALAAWAQSQNEPAGETSTGSESGTTGGGSEESATTLASTTGSETGPAVTTSDAATGEPAATGGETGDGDGGCGCTSAPTRPGHALATLGLLVLGSVRRRPRGTR